MVKKTKLRTMTPKLWRKRQIEAKRRKRKRWFQTGVHGVCRLGEKDVYTKFFFGGNRTDPLNLAEVIANPDVPDELRGDEVGKTLQELNDVHSPPFPYKATLTDPLGLKKRAKKLHFQLKTESQNSTVTQEPCDERLDIPIQMDCSEKAEQPVLKSKRHKYIYGNYDRYYGYRAPGVHPLFTKDPRFSVMRPEWFTGKTVLDIGCNAGYISLWISRFYEPLSVLAIDIDPNLITIAKRNLKYLTNQKKYGDRKLSVDLTEEKPCIKSDIPEASNGSKTNSTSEPIISSYFPKNLFFKTTNYVPSFDAKLDGNSIAEEYDVILCLSVTKWIHLNWGDDGLKRSFLKMYLQLKKGGLLILEPQQIKSYRKKKSLTEEMKKNYKDMKFFPKDFCSYLLSDAVGFERKTIIPMGNVELINPNFMRPIICFYKGHQPRGCSRFNSSDCTVDFEMPPTPP